LPLAAELQAVLDIAAERPPAKLAHSLRDLLEQVLYAEYVPN
jgi:hypothetical protein